MQQQKSKQRYKEIDILKGIAIFFVIVRHSIIVYPINLHNVEWCRILLDMAGTITMPLFFLVSGFCFSYKESFGPYIKKKFDRILLPFLVFNVLDIIPRYLFKGLVNRPKSPLESLQSIFLDGGAYWFLYSLFLIFVIFPFIYKHIKPRTVYSELLIVALFVLRFVDYLPHSFLIAKTMFHFPFFTLGYYLKQVIDLGELKAGILKSKNAAIAIALCCLLVTFSCVTYLSANKNGVIGVPLAFIGILASYIFASLIAEKSLGEFLAEAGEYSLALYLFNGFMLGISRVVGIKLLGFRAPAMIILFNLLIDFGLSFMIIKYFIRRFYFTKKICGFI